MSTKPPSGTRDFLPDDVRKREHVMRVVRDVYESYGFEPLETPAFENIETLLGKYGEEGNRLIFKILKRGEHEGSGEADLALRYDLTVPLARFEPCRSRVRKPLRARRQDKRVDRSRNPHRACHCLAVTGIDQGRVVFKNRTRRRCCCTPRHGEANGTRAGQRSRQETSSKHPGIVFPRRSSALVAKCLTGNR